MPRRRSSSPPPAALAIGGAALLGLTVAAWRQRAALRQAAQAVVDTATAYLPTTEDTVSPRDPAAFTPTSGYRTSYATPAQARAAFGELAQYFAWSEPGVWPKNGAPIPHDVAVAMVTFARTYLDPLRARFGPMRITSWYRPPDYNASVEGASSTSMHPTGWAADFYFLNHRNGYLGTVDVANALAAMNVPWDQAIGYEEGTPRTHLGAKYHDGSYRMLVQEYHPGRSGSDYPVVARWNAGFTRVA